MSKYLIKTILSPVFLILIMFSAMFSASAETSDWLEQLGQSVSANKKISTSDEKEIPHNETTAIPTMKPSYYNAVNSQDEMNQSQNVNKALGNGMNTSDNVPDISKSSDYKNTATPENGVGSQGSTTDMPFATPDLSTPDEAATKGAVNTGDTSVSVFVLLTLISLTSLLIAIHKKEITD